jgi:mRNA interferase MazF
MKKGKIVLIPFPFTDLSSSKRRPALILLERKEDVVVAFISSRIPPILEDQIILINKNHKEFLNTGLKDDSVIYLDKITTIAKDLITGEIGEIGKNLK